MKKILSLILAAALLLGCAAFAEEEYAEVQTGYYIFENNTGEKIMSVTITDNKNPENWFKASRENGFDPGETIAMGFSIPAEDKDTEHRLSVTFVTESGYEATQPTLSIENVIIGLNKVEEADAVSGATPFIFTAMQQTGMYTIINRTGEVVTEVKLVDNVTGDSVSCCPEGGLQDGASIGLGYSVPMDDDPKGRLTLIFTTASGQTWDFTTLAIEEAPIYLLAEDARTGATPITFIEPEK